MKQQQVLIEPNIEVEDEDEANEIRFQDGEYAQNDMLT